MKRAIPMYEAFFQLSRTPFGRDIPTGSLWRNVLRDELNSRLKYVAENRSFGVFTGDAGVGKSTAIRRFTSELDNKRFQSIYITDSSLTPRNFYWAALHQLEQVPRFHRGDAQRQLHKVLSGIVNNERKTPVFIIDEAHLLSHEMLQEVRFLLNSEMDSNSSLALILVGQSELKDKLRLQINAAILQRVDIRYHLPPLDLSETLAYVNAHLLAAGAPRTIFTEAALQQIYKYSNGIPRVINKLASASLMAAASRGVALVDDHLVHVTIEREFSI